MSTTSKTFRGTRRAAIGFVLALTSVSACGSGDSKSNDSASDNGGPKAAAALVAKGLQEHQAGDLGAAKRDYTQAIKDDPTNKFAYYNLGLILQTEGDKAGAENNYRTVLNLDSKYAPALYNLAILRTEAKSIPEAIDLYRRTIASSPKAADAHFNLGLLLRQTGRTDEGNSEVQTAVKLEPSLRERASAEGVPLPDK
jgi:Tfp pilus assembly protein PilF